MTTTSLPKYTMPQYQILLVLPNGMSTFLFLDEATNQAEAIKIFKGINQLAATLVNSSLIQYVKGYLEELGDNGYYKTIKNETFAYERDNDG